MKVIKKNNKKGLAKNKILIGTLSTILCSVPITIGITEILKNNKSMFSNVLGNSFSSIKDSIVKQTLENEGSTWKVTLNNGEIKTFDSPEEIRVALLKNSSIIEETYTSNLDLNEIVNKNTGVIDLQNNPNIAKGKIIDFSKHIYKGKNSEILFDEKKAKESYLKINEAYNFNGIYFKNKIDLKNYLEKEYLSSKDKVQINSIVLEGPNGVKSTSINLNSQNAISIIESFIEANSQKVINYKNSTTNNSINITENNIDNVLNSISTKDMELSHIQSNQGESRYIIDNNVSDEYDLIGPYFYKGNLDIGSFMNKNMWKKVDGVSKQVFQQSEVDKVIGSFFSSIINDDNAANLFENGGSSLFRTPLLINGQPIDEWFFKIIGDFNFDLKNLIIKTNKNLMEGKKYNTFYKIPVLYNFIIQRLFNLNAPQSVLQNTIIYFQKICDFIQGALEAIVLDNTFLIGKDGKCFDMNDLFQIGNSEFDTNTSMEYFLNKLKTNFPSLVGAMSAYMGSVNNIHLFAGLLPYQSYDQKYLVNFGIMSQEIYDMNNKKYSEIYETFSQTNFDSLISKFAKFSDKTKNLFSSEQEISKIISMLNEIKLDKVNDLSLKDYLNSIGTKNTLTYKMHNAAIRDEILQLANHGGYIQEDSYLHTYKKTGKYTSNSSKIIYDMIDALMWKAKANENNPDFDFYKMYLSLMIDATSNGHSIFNNKNALINDYEFSKNIIRIVNTSLVTTGLAAESIKKLYPVGKSLISLSTPLRNALKTRWTQIKHSIPFVMRTWDINASTTFTVRNWSLSSFFSKVNKGFDFLKSAAPIFGAAFLGFEVFVLVFELFKVETTTNYYIYTAADGTEFIWNGGRTESRYFGFDVRETNGISNMKLVEPIQITLPQVEEFYFFNGIKYYDPNQAKKNYVKYILQDEKLLNKNFSMKYTFENKNDIANAEVFDSIEKLKDSVFNSLNIDRNSLKINVEMINFNSKYLSDVVYKYGNIVSFDPNNFTILEKSKFINDILENIRNIYFAKLPQFVESDSSIVIPGISWSDGSYIDNRNKMNEYVINTLANEVDKDNNYKIKNEMDADKKSKEVLKNDFINKSIVESKVAFVTNDFSSLLNSKYENVNSNLKEYKVYTVIKPGRGKYQFLDKSKAEKFAMDYKKIEKQFTTKTIYIYNGMVFHSEKEIDNWLKANESIKG